MYKQPMLPETGATGVMLFGMEYNTAIATIAFAILLSLILFRLFRFLIKDIALRKEV